MKILILTQTVNKKDPILGFFHGWINEFAKYYDMVTVICLYEGEHNLPENVKVFSLGKEKGVNKLKYLLKFYKYILKERKNYDKVFVHMNEEYVLLGGLIWRFMNKRVSLWRNHKSGSWKTYLASKFVDNVFYTSEGSYTARFPNAHIMPVGINEEIFHPINNIVRKQNSFLYVGRISPIKNIDKMIDGFTSLHKEKSDISFTFDLIGPVLGKLDEDYKNSLVLKVNNARLENSIRFFGAKSQEFLPEVYSAYSYCMNLTESGSFDKTIWESIFCGCVPVVYNKSFLNEIPKDISDQIGVNSFDNVSETIEGVLNSKRESISRKLMEIKDKHSLTGLMEKLVKII